MMMMIYELQWLFLVGQFRHHTFPFCAHRYPPSHVSHLLLSSLQHVRTSASGLLRFPDDGQCPIDLMYFVTHVNL